jgi:uncharacterized Tic20 family protein
MALPDEDERLTAAMAHASVVANVAGLTGLILAVLLWATQRRRSRFVRAHIVQALVYQIGTLLGVIALMLLWSGCCCYRCCLLHCDQISTATAPCRTRSGLRCSG